MKIDRFSIQFCKESIYHSMDCHPENPVYTEVETEYETMEQKAYSLIVPEAYLVFSRVPAYAAGEAVSQGAEVLYALTTAGRAISDWSRALFAEGNYLAGMLADAMADNYLFQMQKELEASIISLCREARYGVSRRLEAPNGVRMEIQKAALEAVRAAERTDIGITESFMYDPLKTVCQVYVLQKNSEEYHIEHNCRTCPAIHCKLRSVSPVSVLAEGFSGCKGPVRLQCAENQTIRQLLLENSIYLNADCNGRGSCGACKIRVLEGSVPVSETERGLLTEEEIENGIRLACKASPETDCRIVPYLKEEQFSVVSGFAGMLSDNRWENQDWGIAIDIGSTTIAMQLTDRKSGAAADTYTAVNRQRAYGADVISRIQASVQGKQEELKRSILTDLQRGIDTLLQKNNISETSVGMICIAGNTTMLHLLLGYSCKTLGVYPFTPVSTAAVHTDWAEIMGEGNCRIPVLLLPGISTFIGADITAGMLACGMDALKEPVLFLDLGTNAEMALGNRERILTASAAAGPAFEAGNISCGTGSVPGAICHVRVCAKKAKVTTIGEKTPVGLCGTGVTETVYELWKEGILDETGLLAAEYFDTGFPLAKDAAGRMILFTQKDVREFQLAKAAVRAGLEALLVREGMTGNQVKQIYVAGGFGYHMDYDKAIGIGLFPKSFAGRITAVGNSALRGAADCLRQHDALERIEELIRKSGEISLSTDAVFLEKYMEAMCFEEE